MRLGRGGALHGLKRLLVTVYLVLGMLCSLLVYSKPILVSVADVLLVLFSTMAGCSSCVFSVWDWKAYSFRSSLIDIPLLSLVRSSAALCIYSCSGCQTFYLRYFVVTIVSGVFSLVFLTIKAAAFNMEGPVSPSLYREVQHLKNSPALPLLFMMSMAFGFAHIVAAHKARTQARRRLVFRWEDEEAMFDEKEHHRRASPRGNIVRLAKMLEGRLPKMKNRDMPASLLADPDSLFMTCDNITVHYKLVQGQSVQHSQGNNGIPSPRMNGNYYPVEQVLDGCQDLLGEDSESLNERNGAVLIHGFGGGAFSWRHVMVPLARQSRCTVVAFDRPGWGLTSRPGRSEWEKNGTPNPYELQSQVDLLFTICEKLHLRSLVLVGHDDGGLLALMAASKASKLQNTCKVDVKGVVLVGVSLSREVVPSFARVLLHTPLGRQMLKPLLRTEIGQVANRRAWHDASKLTSDILELYKAPLRVEGWDEALAEVSRATSILLSSSAAEVLQAVSNLPALLVAGVQDMLVPINAAENLATKLPQSKLIAIPGCGHVPPEECPAALLAAMLPFISGLLNDEGTL